MDASRHLPRARPQAAGFTLVEVLVALVVLAVGLLGIAGPYVEGLRAGRTSVYRTTAVTLASDMADRLRLNPTGDYTGAGPGEDRDCVNGVDPCDPDSLAQDDWFRWLEELRLRLPAGAGATIERQDLAPLEQFVIRIEWPEVGQETPASYTLALQL